MAKWGDMVDEERAGVNEDDMLPPDQITGPDENGIKTVITHVRNEQGDTVKITRKVRVGEVTKRVNAAVARRRAWRKFGAASGAGVGPEKGVTLVGDDITLDLTPKSEVKESKKTEVDHIKERLAATATSVVVCRICQGAHWTSKCKFKDEPGVVERMGKERAPAAGETLGASGILNAMGGDRNKAGGGYVPPHKRAGAKPGARGASMEGSTGSMGMGPTCTLRVSNLSENATEQDVRELFQRFGRIQRLYLAKDRDTGESRGFAFVTFFAREDAQLAMDKVDGLPYDHLILSVEWAEERERPGGY